MLNLCEWVPRIRRHVMDCGIDETSMGLYDPRLADDNFLYEIVKIMKHPNVMDYSTATGNEYSVMVFKDRRKRFVDKYPLLSFHLDTSRFVTMCLAEIRLTFIKQRLLRHRGFSNGILIYLLSNLPDELSDDLADEVQLFLNIRKPIYSHRQIRDYLSGDEI